MPERDLPQRHAVADARLDVLAADAPCRRPSALRGPECRSSRRPRTAISAMRAERLGSYSIDTTVAQMSSLRRLKSMMRYIRLWPPPRKRDVTMPWLFRPPFLGSGFSSDFSGFFLRSVMSAKSLTEPPRRPGVVGLYWRMPMSHPDSVDSSS